MNNCDMCGSKIENGKCDCGEWIYKEKMEKCLMEMTLENFHELKRFTITGDAPHLGCAVIFFRGDYNDCKKIQKYIYKIKNRPFYEE